MAHEQLAAARDLIKAKRYQEARQVLKVIADHPTARAWLAKLDEIAPAEDDPFAVFDAPAPRPAIQPLPKPKKQSHRVRNYVLALIVSIALVAFGYFVYLYATNRNYQDSRRREASATLQVFCSISLRLPDYRCTQWANETFDADINKVSDVMVCDSIWSWSKEPQEFANCLARNRIYLPR